MQREVPSLHRVPVGQAAVLHGSVGYLCLLLAGHSEWPWSNRISSTDRLLQVDVTLWRRDNPLER